LLALALVAACERGATDIRQGAYGGEIGPAVSAGLTADPGAPTTADTGPTFRFVGSGEQADVSFYSYGDSGGGGSGFSYGYLAVFQGASAGVRQTQLYYYVLRCDFSYTCTYEAGYGPIPDGDLQGNARAGFRLTTNTSDASNPAFFRWAGNGGPIELAWRPNGFNSTQTHTSSQSQYGDIMVRSSGGTVSASAWVDGSVVFTPVANAWGNTGSFQSASIQIQLANAVAGASGSGQLTIGGELRTFAFSAVKLADGRVGGQWERYNRAAGVRDHGRTTCLSILNRSAWLGGTATTEGAPGEVGWRVLDADGGAQRSRDQISLQFVGGDPGFAAQYCAAQGGDPPLLDIEAGNITVR
jgi:hypothetical protein